MIRPRRAAALAGVLVLVATGCGGGGTRGYLDSATTTVGTALSEARTAQAVLEAYRAGHATTAYTRVVVAASDASLSATADSFAAEDPPTAGLDEQRRRLLSDIAEAQEALADARIGLGRNDDEAVRASLEDLSPAADTLERDLEALE